ncbi:MULTISPECIES: ABC transporter substrate-binding protein [Limibacillus]|uniref:Putative spermidine/putrescine transport system substrate-binding protein n=1 Tax=Limibacillus halophilus TaxID=1579333 RepID=A0A839SS70_9PROT|nr:ABC transporter substrate-binding protein [Limibacillus halophilus]MBB3063743.1 putative spermidine/putrescine transport system substrate-binding protein [Limibacillus halophilus]
MKYDSGNMKVTRRDLLLAAGAGVASVGAMGLPSKLLAAERITVADPGGPFKDAFGEAFYRPYEKASGITVANIAREHQPTSHIQAIVETKSYTWDVVTVTLAGQVLLGARDLLEDLDWSGEHMQDIMPEARAKNWMGTDVYATTLAYRQDTLKGKEPRSWADFWDVKGFPGRRALRRSPIDTLEIALLADGVDPKDLYPLDIERALNKLDDIRGHIDVWWTGGAQTSQLLQTGEVDMLPTWNGRAQTVIDGGAPVSIEWNQGLYSMEGWAIPKGNPKADLGRKFISYCADPERQAAFTNKLAYGPTNPKAYNFISAERAKSLPTAPQNIERMVLADQGWWGEHKEAAEQRFNEWLLS